MAKTNSEKLVSLIEKAAAMNENAVVGELDGQYPQSSNDALMVAISAAHEIAIGEESSEEQVSSALESLATELKLFQGSIVKAEKPKEPKSDKLTLKGVVLRGGSSQKKGTHTIHFGSGVISFIDGKANVRDEQEKELRSAGYIE